MTLLFIYLAIAIGVSFICSVLEAVLLSITPSFREQLSTQQQEGIAPVCNGKNKKAITSALPALYGVTALLFKTESVIPNQFNQPA